MKILMIGTGYVGLVTGTCFAEMGHIVTCLDIDQTKIDNLKKGILPIYEPGLKELVSRNTNAKRLFFSTNYKTTIPNTEICFIAVPTPSLLDGSCNISFIENAAKQIAKYMNLPLIIVNKSTSPVGTSELIRKAIQKVLDERKSRCIFDVASNPEFLKEGTAIQDCMKPDRIIIGTQNKETEKVLRKIYEPFLIKSECFLFMNTTSSELTKYAANAMLATRISFMNELAKMCDAVGANIHEIRKGIGSDTRIGSSFLYAGIGYGGSCFPKDIRALIALSQKNGLTLKLLKAVDIVNNDQKKLMITLLTNYFRKLGGLKGKTIAIWGLSFKPDTDDVREAPALTLIDKLQQEQVQLRLYDPIAMENTKKAMKNFNNISWCKDEFEAALGADAICLLTEWKQFRLVNFRTIGKSMKKQVLFDGRNQYKASEMKEKGFDYIGIGVPNEIIHNS